MSDLAILSFVINILDGIPLIEVAKFFYAIKDNSFLSYLLLCDSRLQFF